MMNNDTPLDGIINAVVAFLLTAKEGSIRSYGR